MKKIVLKQFVKNGNYYMVSLGNGTVHTFTSLRSCTDYLNKTNKFLTRQLFDVHATYMDLWQEYQRLWFYFGSNVEKGRWGLHVQDKRTIDENLATCEERLEFCIENSDSANANYFSFKNIRVAINALKATVKILLPLLQKRSSTAEIYRLNSIFTRLLAFENKLQAYGQLEAVQHTIDFKTNAA